MPDPKVGPADPETRRRMMEKHISEGAKEKVGQIYGPRGPAPKKDSKVSQGPVISGQRRANAIDSIANDKSVVDYSIESGNPEPSKYPRGR